MRFITKHQLQEEFSILQVISEINSTAVRVIHRFVSSHLTSCLLLSSGFYLQERKLWWGQTEEKQSFHGHQTGAGGQGETEEEGGQGESQEGEEESRERSGLNIMLRREGQRMIFDHCCQGVFYVDAQRNMAVTMGERDVKMDVKEKSRLFIFSVWWTMITGWFRRDKYLSSAMVEGDTAESYIAQVRWRRRRREMRVKLKSPGPDWDEEDV